ncbi:hypothetical protein D3C76_1296760 [compost metagenome]
MAWLRAPQKSPYQTPSRASSTGMLPAKGAVRKCWSMLWAPDSSSLKLEMPMDMAIGRPMADHSE